MKITVDDLEKFLKEHKDEIDYVYLEYAWEPKYYQKLASVKGVDAQGHQRYLYHRFACTEIDSEYSYAGDVEGAIRFAEDYACWDGREISFDDGVVFAKHKQVDWDSEEHPCDLHHDNGLDDLGNIDVEYMGLFYYDRRHEACYYDGPLARARDDREANE